ncbi:MAG: hypothetical protein U0Q16_29265 [Bryobacteraceae bacterium]
MHKPACFAMLAATLLAASFWDSKEPKDWSEDELNRLLTDSPWARSDAYLASSEAMRLAEQEWRRRHEAKQLDAPDPGEDDYFEFIRNDRGKHVVLAVRVTDFNQMADAKEIREMEKNCWLRSGKQKIRASGHFPPTSRDAFLRLVFPRPEAAVKNLKFDLYLPGVAGTFRQLEFELKEMSYKGRTDY